MSLFYLLLVLVQFILTFGNTFDVIFEKISKEKKKEQITLTLDEHDSWNHVCGEFYEKKISPSPGQVAFFLPNGRKAAGDRQLIDDNIRGPGVLIKWKFVKEGEGSFHHAHREYNNMMTGGYGAHLQQFDDEVADFYYDEAMEEAREQMEKATDQRAQRMLAKEKENILRHQKQRKKKKSEKHTSEIQTKHT
eukprot:500851_1